ncbi:hypothetical protein LJB98_02450 [Bacteroidales bacterium OttesenSCG-928-M11]|nr:hypothetical protein [Bacteroidales bacterium OttesenSCG-928-M11]
MGTPQSETGIYWSSTASGTASITLETTSSSTATVTTNGYRGRGNGVRCVKVN